MGKLEKILLTGIALAGVTSASPNPISEEIYLAENSTQKIERRVYTPSTRIGKGALYGLYATAISGAGVLILKSIYDATNNSQTD